MGFEPSATTDVFMTLSLFSLNFNYEALLSDQPHVREISEEDSGSAKILEAEMATRRPKKSGTRLLVEERSGSEEWQAVMGIDLV
jgi:hypothetical protein